MKICTIIPFFSNNITSPHLCDSSLGSSVTAPNNNTSLYDTSYKLVLSNHNPTAQARPHYNHRENLIVKTSVVASSHAVSLHNIWLKKHYSWGSTPLFIYALSFFYIYVRGRTLARALVFFVFIVSSALIGKGHLSNHEMQNQVIHEQNGAWASHDEWMNSLFHRMFQLLRTINTSWGRLYVLAATYDFPLSWKARFLSLVMHKRWSKCVWRKHKDDV